MFPRIVGFRRKIIDLVGIRPIITYCWQKLDFSEILLLLIVRFFPEIRTLSKFAPPATNSRIRAYKIPVIPVSCATAS